MAVFTVPTSTTEGYYEIDIELDGVIFLMAFKFNKRDSAWYLDILDADGNHLRSGIRVINDWSLLRLWNLTVRPDGDLITVADDQQVGPAQINELGENVILTYVGNS